MKRGNLILLMLSATGLWNNISAINQQVIFRNEALENVFVTIDVIKIMPTDKFEIPHGTSKNYFVPLLSSSLPLYLTIDSAGMQKEYRIKYDAQNSKLFIQRNDFVLDEINYSSSSSNPIVIVYSRNYEARFQK